MGPQSFDLCLRRLGRGSRIGNRQFRAVDIERVEEWFVVQQRRVIDVERDFADHRERVFPVFEIVNANVLRDQPADWIDGQPRDRRFDAALMQFLRNAIAPFFAEAALRQVPARPAEDENERNDREAENAARSRVVRLRAAAIELAREGRRRRF